MGDGILGRRIFALAVVIVLLISIIPERLEAYTGANYYKNQIVKVGLKDMQSASIAVTFNGDFSGGDKTFKSGTSLIMTIQNGQLSFDGILYNELVLTTQDNNAYITLNSGASKIRNYKGNFKFILNGGSILPINSLNIEEYLKGVVGYEMSDYFALEALKAQAVTARS
jgi:stage II sporulation protein D